jgi:hypothetical protein
MELKYNYIDLCHRHNIVYNPVDLLRDRLHNSNFLDDAARYEDFSRKRTLSFPLRLGVKKSPSLKKMLIKSMSRKSDRDLKPRMRSDYSYTFVESEEDYAKHISLMPDEMVENYPELTSLIGKRRNTIVEGKSAVTSLQTTTSGEGVRERVNTAPPAVDIRLQPPSESSTAPNASPPEIEIESVVSH